MCRAKVDNELIYDIEMAGRLHDPEFSLKQTLSNIKK